MEKVVGYIKENAASFDAVEILTAKRNSVGQLEVTVHVKYGTGASGFYSGYDQIFEDPPVEVTVRSRIHRDHYGLGGGSRTFIGTNPLPRYRWYEEEEAFERLFEGEWVLDYDAPEVPDRLEVFLVTRGYAGGYTRPNQPYLQVATIVCHENDEHTVWREVREAFHGRNWLVVSPENKAHTLVNLDSWWADSRSYAPVSEDSLTYVSNRAAKLEERQKELRILMRKFREEGNEAVEAMPNEFWSFIGGKPGIREEFEEDLRPSLEKGWYNEAQFDASVQGSLDRVQNVPIPREAFENLFDNFFDPDEEE